MATRNEHRQQKKAEKQRLARKADQKARRVRAQGVTTSGESARAAGWSVGPAWASDGWYEQGAQVRAVFTRRRPDGRCNAAIVEVDLAEKGVVAVKLLSDLTDDRLLAEVGRRSEERAMHEVEPDLVARIVRDGSEWGTSQGHAQARDLDEVLALMGDVDGSDSDPVKVGHPGAVQPPPAGEPGVFARFQRWLCGDPVPPRS